MADVIDNSQPISIGIVQFEDFTTYEYLDPMAHNYVTRTPGTLTATMMQSVSPTDITCVRRNLPSPLQDFHIQWDTYLAYQEILGVFPAFMLTSNPSTTGLGSAAINLDAIAVFHITFTDKPYLLIHDYINNWEWSLMNYTVPIQIYWDLQRTGATLSITGYSDAARTAVICSKSTTMATNPAFNYIIPIGQREATVGANPSRYHSTGTVNNLIFL